MMKCRRRQARDPQKLKKCQRLFSRFFLVKAEAIGVKAEAINEIAAYTSLNGNLIIPS